jgi:hypothetical protein
MNNRRNELWSVRKISVHVNDLEGNEAKKPQKERKKPNRYVPFGRRESNPASGLPAFIEVKDDKQIKARVRRAPRPINLLPLILGVRLVLQVNFPPSVRPKWQYKVGEP